MGGTLVSATAIYQTKCSFTVLSALFLFFQTLPYDSKLFLGWWHNLLLKLVCFRYWIMSITDIIKFKIKEVFWIRKTAKLPGPWPVLCPRPTGGSQQPPPTHPPRCPPVFLKLLCPNFVWICHCLNEGQYRAIKKKKKKSLKIQENAGYQ